MTDDEASVEIKRLLQETLNMHMQVKQELLRLQMTPTPKPIGHTADFSKGKLSKLMTGQEWYDRFIKVMGDAATSCSGCSCDAVVAARKASGLDNE